MEHMNIEIKPGVNIVGVQFRRAGRIYDFSSGANNVRVGDDVVVETERGPSLAKVAQVRYHMDGESGANKDLKPILRMASRRDLDDASKLTPAHAVAVARDKAERLSLKMSVLHADVQFGGSKVVVFFSAPGRVDFRDLVKDLATSLRSRVELKQVGARDEAKLVGGLGICGREFCCSSFLREFVPVSIKMAKNQNLALNPSKVSGGCGRLLCCLTYENDLYTELRRLLPPRGTRVRSLEDGVVGDVIKGDILNQVLLIETAEGRQVTVPVAQTELVEKHGGARPEGSEADDWGEDIDVAALAQLEDDTNGASSSGGGRQARPSGGGEKSEARGGRSDRPDRHDRPDRPDRPGRPDRGGRGEQGAGGGPSGGGRRGGGAPQERVKDPERQGSGQGRQSQRGGPGGGGAQNANQSKPQNPVSGGDGGKAETPAVLHEKTDDKSGGGEGND